MTRKRKGPKFSLRSSGNGNVFKMMGSSPYAKSTPYRLDTEGGDSPEKDNDNDTDTDTTPVDSPPEIKTTSIDNKESGRYSNEFEREEGENITPNDDSNIIDSDTAANFERGDLVSSNTTQTNKKGGSNFDETPSDYTQNRLDSGRLKGTTNTNEEFTMNAAGDEDEFDPDSDTDNKYIPREDTTINYEETTTKGTSGDRRGTMNPSVNVNRDGSINNNTMGSFQSKSGGVKTGVNKQGNLYNADTGNVSQLVTQYGDQPVQYDDTGNVVPINKDDSYSLADGSASTEGLGYSSFTTDGEAQSDESMGSDINQNFATSQMNSLTDKENRDNQNTFAPGIVKDKTKGTNAAGENVTVKSDDNTAKWTVNQNGLNQTRDKTKVKEDGTLVRKTGEGFLGLQNRKKYIDGVDQDSENTIKNIKQTKKDAIKKQKKEQRKIKREKNKAIRQNTGNKPRRTITSYNS